MIRSLAFCLLAAMLGACASTPPAEPRSIPMRVAVIPIDVVGDRDRVDADDLDDTDMVLRRDGRRYAQAVVEALDERLFAQAFLLEPPAVGTDASIDWAQLAEQSGADAILALDLDCNPRVMEASNNGYYLNFLLFVIGGPFCWWLPDHTYDVEAKLSAELYDVTRLRRERATPGSESSVLARISDASAPSERVEMAFTSRADGDVGQYALSVVWPAPLLMEDNDELRDSLEESTVRTLAQRLAADMRADRELIVEGPFVAPFHVDVETLRAARGAGGLELRADVLIAAESRVEEVTEVQVRLGAERFTVPTRAGEPRTIDGRRYRVARVEWQHAGSAGDALQLVIEAETPSLVTRTYTVPIEAARGGA